MKKPHVYFKYFILVMISFIMITCENDQVSDLQVIVGSETGTGGSMARFTIAKDHLYTVSENILSVYDINNTNQPVQLNDVIIGSGIETIFPDNNRLFIGSQSGMYIYDISNPRKPGLLGNYQHIVACDPVVTEGDYAYVTLHSQDNNCGRWTNELQIIDISDENDPSLVYSYQMSSPRGLSVRNDTLLVCDDGLKMLDISDKYNIKELAAFDIEANDIIWKNNLVMVIGQDGLYQYKLENGKIDFLSKLEINAY